MSLTRIFLLLTTLFFCTTVVSANTFTVTTNADSGPGSLRDAITQAAANGSAAPDNIVFNISDLSETGRTINLQTELPALSSSLVIDGTTQPGAVFGISNAKVKLFLSTYPSTGYFTCLLVENASSVAIYGLFLAYPTDPRSGGELYGIRIKNSSGIIIGAKGKGNVIDGWFWNITNSYYNYFSDNSNTISIKGNILGLSENGTLAVTTPIDILMNNTYNLEVGGADPAEGNLMNASYSCLQASHNDPAIQGSYFARVINNKADVDLTGTIPYYGGITGSIQLNGVNIPTTDTEVVKTEVINNIISGSYEHMQLMIVNIRHLVKVMGNKLGTDITGTHQIGNADVGLYISGCYKVLIGSDDPADKNYFSGNETGLIIGGTPKALITKNSFFCNGQGILLQSFPGPNPKPFITMDTYTASLIAGKSNPLAKIELFQNHDCAYGSCQGKTYVATVFADNAGNWSYAGTQTPAMIATATTTDSATSEFPLPQLSADNPVIVDASCGKNNGSITGLKVFNGAYFQWVNDAGNTVGTGTDLLNAGPGTYRLIVAFGPNSCSVSSASYTIHTTQPPSTVSTGLVDPTCGQKNGQILLYTDLTGLTAKWVDAAGDTLAFIPSSYFNPGTYYLILYPSNDYSCVQKYGPYVLVNQGGASIDISSVLVTSASCHLSNGSITSLQFQNTTGSLTYRWVDASGRTAGNSADLINVPAGQYQLKFKDGGTCDTITTDLFTIGSTGLVQIDTSAKTILPGKCSLNNGSIRNITVTNPLSYRWIDTVTRTVAGNTADLNNVPPGYYRLIVTNTFGCTDSAGPYHITDEPAPVINNAVITPDICSEQTGSVTQLSVQGSLPFTYAWYDTNGPLQVQGQDLTNRTAGSYYVVITDAENCNTTSPLYTIKDSSLLIDPPSYKDLVVLKGNSGTLTLLNPAVGNYGLYASAGDPNPDQQNTTGNFVTGPINQDTTVYVLLKKGNCASTLSAVAIKMIETLTISMPNAFTPNNDGHNDLFRVKYPQIIKTFRMTIYNRWGQMIFSTTDPYRGWDGAIGGIAQPMGNYVWTMAYQDIIGNSRNLSGSVLLLR